MTTCLSLLRVELEKGESNNDGVTVVSRHASGGPYDVARRKILSWPLKSLKLKWRELNKNSPPVMWHGVVGADDNSFLVVVASRQKCPFSPARTGNGNCHGPSVQHDNECTFQQKKSEK